MGILKVHSLVSFDTCTTETATTIKTLNTSVPPQASLSPIHSLPTLHSHPSADILELEDVWPVSWPRQQAPGQGACLGSGPQSWGASRGSNNTTFCRPKSAFDWSASSSSLACSGTCCPLLVTLLL